MEPSDTSKVDERIARTKRVIALFGGVEPVMRITGKSRTRVYSWTYVKAKGGTDGFVPPECQEAMLVHAAQVGLRLSPYDFLPTDLQPKEAA